ncbi:MAG: type I restriction modification enzyme S chain [Candidatus Scalindua brodae]|uniref:Type I restriction modification enzyme S chain n=1 Tax=Candidatus Scalindua brodae TaxID=237368 RepID=A0A0B0EMF3_9BACT|nr:MAG: type I restriction modification enzyme S chain [Candidatus Scalindua brodae]
MHKRVAPKVNDILLAKNGTTGVAAMVDRDIVFDIYVSLAHIRVLDEISPNFMLYFINSPAAKKQFHKRLKGIGVPNLHLKEIREVEILYPKSLPEQKRIVAILDKAFAAIAKAKANAERNLKNAKELFESYLQGVFENKGEGWEEKKLGEVCHVKGGKRLPKGHKLTSEDTGLPYIRARDLKQETVLVEQTLFLKPETQNLIKNYTVKAGDVYITIVGVNIGDVGTIPAKMAGANLTENAAKIIIKNSISNIYLVKWLTSETSRRNIIRATMAAAQGKLALTRIKDLPIFYPPPEIQEEILTKINNLSFETKKLETIYQQKIDDLKELKKSVLQKAFEGQL